MQQSSTHGRERPFDPDNEQVGAVDVAITLSIDATDVRRGIVQISETVGITQAGSLTLLYPKWLPGYHAPEAPINLVADLRIRCADRALVWRRDPVDIHAFHVEVPEGEDQLRIDFQLLSPTAPEQGRVRITPRQLNLQWNALLLYPAGLRSSQIGVAAQVHLPEGWTLACALPHESRGGMFSFPQTPLDVLVDSPIGAGRHCRRYDIDACVALNLFGDDAAAVDVGAQALTEIKNLVIQADKLFASRPFGHYDFLIAISDELGDLGVEHRQSTELVLPPNFFADWEENRSGNDVLAHEYVHAWNGKFRKGEGACTTSFDQPLRNDLLWVYEGLTQYWGQVLATRAGLWDAQLFRDALALIAARCCNMKGRRWRPLSDTTRDPIVAGTQLPWESWQRNQDYYTDGQLLWLTVDVILRQESGNKVSLDDFGRMFFGGCSSTSPVLPYRLDDLLDALEDLVAYDWKTFFDQRLNACEAEMPLDGLNRSGYQISYRHCRSNFHRQTDALSGLIDLTFSAGFSASADGKVQEVIWDSPAFQANLTAGAEILAVNDQAFSTEALCHAITDREALCLWVKKLNHCETLTLPYSGGHRFPHLARLEDRPALLDCILEPRP